MSKKKALIIGGGFAGCASAHMLALRGNWDVDLIEKRPYLGAGVKTQWYGGHPYTFGPRHFLTQDTRAYDHLNAYCPLRRCSEHVFLSYVESDRNFYNYPIHMDDINKMPDSDIIQKELSEKPKSIFESSNFEEFWINSVGRSLYQKFIESYSRKMWQINDNALIDDFGWSPKGVTIKSGPREAWDTAISAYPVATNGYDDYFRLATENAAVHLNTEIEKYDITQKRIQFAGEVRKYDAIINTVSPDTLFDHCYGELPFIGRQFYKFVLPVQFAFPENVYFLYLTGNEPITRIVEYKKFTRQRYSDDQTILGVEIPTIDGGKHYPLPFKSEYVRAQKYFDLMPEGVFSIGRAGSYRYHVDIDDCILQAMEVAANL